MNHFRSLTSLLAVFVLSLGFISPALRTSAQSPVPAAAPAGANTNLDLAGIKQKTTVRRDGRGIPYIAASSESDLYFAQGYVTASDRLFQMDLLRRTARGELSELFGSLTLNQDKQWRKYGFAQLVQAQLAKTPPAAREMLDSYARGVNAYIAGLDAKSLPPECQLLRYTPRPWEPADTLVIGKIFAEALSSTWNTDVMRAGLSDVPAAKRAALLTEFTPLDVLVVGKDSAAKTATTKTTSGDTTAAQTLTADSMAVLDQDKEIRRESLARFGLYTEDRAASNNWVISGKRTVTGKPILANDPHLPPSAPSIWYLVNLTAPGLHVAGVTAPGLPGVVIGHNDRIAWGMTNLGPDVQDLYLETFDAQDPKKYQTPTGMREAEVRTEQIKVRKSFENPATDSVAFDVTLTRHGPIFFESEGKRYALRWTALDPDSGEIAGLYELNRAGNWKEFTVGLSKYGGATQNFIFADLDGNIGYYGAGHIPVRSSGDGSVPYDGAKAEGEWTGYIPFGELPHVYNPPEGFIVTANQRIAGSSYQHFLTHDWAQPFRARRIYDTLKTNTKVSLDDVRDLQRDLYSIFVSDLVREVVKLSDANPETPGDQEWNDTIALFRNWDGRLAADAKAPAIASQMLAAFNSKILTAAIGPARAKSFAWSNTNMLLRQLVTEKPKEWLPAEYSDYLSFLRACVKEARANLTKQVGPDPTTWTWGAIRPANFPHPFSTLPLIGPIYKIPTFPLNGGSSTVNVGSYVSMRFIADLSGWDRSRHTIALGESGNPSSPHWKDQLDQWKSGDTPEFPFSQAAVEKATREVLTLNPAAK